MSKDDTKDQHQAGEERTPLEQRNEVVPLDRVEPGPPDDQYEYELRLYVAGQTPKSLSALRNVQELCDTHLKGRCRVEIVDLLENPHLAQGDQILAIPTLVRKLPPPLRRIIGDLSNTEHTLVGLDLKQRGQ